jgi:hypothetical protein
MNATIDFERARKRLGVMDGVNVREGSKTASALS